jgi:hypothetical protein
VLEGNRWIGRSKQVRVSGHSTSCISLLDTHRVVHLGSSNEPPPVVAWHPNGEYFVVASKSQGKDNRCVPLIWPKTWPLIKTAASQRLRLSTETRGPSKEHSPLMDMMPYVTVINQCALVCADFRNTYHLCRRLACSLGRLTVCTWRQVEKMIKSLCGRLRIGNL